MQYASINSLTSNCAINRVARSLFLSFQNQEGKSKMPLLLSLASTRREEMTILAPPLYDGSITTQLTCREEGV